MSERNEAHVRAGTISGDEQILRQLTSTARELAREVPGPLHRVSLAMDGAMVELEWADGQREVAAAVAQPPSRGLVLAPSPVPVDDALEVTVRSPIVGTFYRARAPGEPPFVVIGGTVEPNTVVGIVEAMKLMNPIAAGHTGMVRAIPAVDGGPVEFDGALVVLDTGHDEDGDDR
jgi:acetyl-CoA carboxylase biotin carboxyl carrier protein